MNIFYVSCYDLRPVIFCFVSYHNRIITNVYMSLTEQS